MQTRSIQSRTLISLLLVVSLVSSSFLSGCGLVGGGNNSPFSLESDGADLTEAQAAFAVDGDTIETILASNPFYSGMQPLQIPGVAEYETQRQAVVDEIVAEADALAVAVGEFEPGVAELRGYYATYLNDCITADKSTQDFAKTSLAELGTNITKIISTTATYESIEATEGMDALSASMIRYTKVGTAVDLGGLAMKDLEDVMAHSAIALEAMSSLGNADIDAAGERFNGEMASADALVEQSSAIADHMVNIDYGFRQLATADYYFGLEAVGFMATEITELETLIAEAETNENVTDADIALMAEQVGMYRDWNDWLYESLESIDTSGAVEVSDEGATGVSPFALGPEPAYGAYAPQQDYSPGSAFKKAGSALGSGLKKVGDGLAWTWGGIRDGFGKAKTVVGVGVDGAGALVKNLAAIPLGVSNKIFYGAPLSDIQDNMTDNVEHVFDNYYNSTSGSDTFQQANEYLENMEDGAKYLGDGAGKIFGDNMVGHGASWVLGNGAKVTVGLFTDLGKGIYVVLDKKSSDAEVAFGFVQIGLSLVGGSKVVMKGSQIPGLLKGAGTNFKNAAQALKVYLGEVGEKGVMKSLKAESAKILEQGIAKGFLKPTEALKLITNAKLIKTQEVVLGAMKDLRAGWIQKIKDAIAKGTAAEMVHVKEEIAKSLQEMFKKSGGKGLEKLMGAAKTGLGENWKEWFNNAFGNWIDDQVKDLIASALEGPPEPTELNGTWSGSYIISEYEVLGEVPEGCDLSQLDELKGQSRPLKLTFNLSDSGTGTASGDAGSMSVSYDRESGAITISGTEEGSKSTFRGTVVRGEGADPQTPGPLSMSGDFSSTAEYLKISGTWSMAK